MVKQICQTCQDIALFDHLNWGQNKFRLEIQGPIS